MKRRGRCRKGRTLKLGNSSQYIGYVIGLTTKFHCTVLYVVVHILYMRVSNKDDVPCVCVYCALLRA